MTEPRNMPYHQLRLNALMDFGHVVYSDGDGHVTDRDIPDVIKFSAPESVYAELDEKDSLAQPERFYDVPQGWELLRGYSGGYSYHGAIMDPAECIGGALERDIRETPGYYVSVIVGTIAADSADADNDEIGWAVAYHDPLPECDCAFTPGDSGHELHCATHLAGSRHTATVWEKRR